MKFVHQTEWVGRVHQQKMRFAPQISADRIVGNQRVPLINSAPAQGQLKHSQNSLSKRQVTVGVQLLSIFLFPKINFCPSQSLVLYALRTREAKRPQQDAYMALGCSGGRNCTLPISHPADTSVPHEAEFFSGHTPNSSASWQSALQCKNRVVPTNRELRSTQGFVQIWRRHRKFSVFCSTPEGNEISVPKSIGFFLV